MDVNIHFILYHLHSKYNIFRLRKCTTLLVLGKHDNYVFILFFVFPLILSLIRFKPNFEEC